MIKQSGVAGSKANFLYIFIGRSVGMVDLFA